MKDIISRDNTLNLPTINSGGQTMREINEDCSTYDELFKAGDEFRECLFSNMSDEEISKFISDCIKELRNENRVQCDKTNCGSNYNGICGFETPNKNFEKCYDFWTIE